VVNFELSTGSATMPAWVGAAPGLLSPPWQAAIVITALAAAKYINRITGFFTNVRGLNYFFLKATLCIFSSFSRSL
jgi:hypothetical protein